MSLQEFSAVFSLLAVQLRATDTDEMTIRGYFTALQDVPLAAVAASAKQFSRESDRRFFPTSAEWYQAAQQATVETLRKALPAARSEPWHYDCEACQDTGWKPYDCVTGQVTCGRMRPHEPHCYVRQCPCRPMNQTFQRHQRFGVGS